MSSTLDSTIFPRVTYKELFEYIVNAPANYSKWWMSLYQSAPHHVWVETSLLVFIVWLMFIRKTVDPTKSTDKMRLTKQEEQMLVDSWTPEPLIPSGYVPKDTTDSTPLVEYMRGSYLKLKDRSAELLNLSSFDFFGMGQNGEVKEAAAKALEKYGCGSCGPRGFYGTIDVHLLFEAAISKFMGTEEAICYSDGASAISSEIPAFAKKGDLLLVDCACSEPIYTGVCLSRATIQFFNHNDMAELRKILESIAKDDKRLKRDTTQQRRWIIVEGVYRNSGNICPLPEVLALKKEFGYRLFLEESYSFGTLGATGRGATEHFGVSVNEIDILNVSLETALGSVGGVCVGTREVVDHQRLSGAGYCFSAAAPPFLSAVAIQSLAHLENDASLIRSLRTNIDLFHCFLTSDIYVASCRESAIIHLNLKWQKDFGSEKEIMEACAAFCKDNCVAVVAKCELSYSKSSLRPSLRIVVTSGLKKEEIENACQVINNAFETTTTKSTTMCSTFF